MNKVTLSIAICSYNRADELALTLSSFLDCSNELQAADEILLVDNNSQDHTKSIAEHYSDHLPLRYVFESTQGLSSARNRALSEFRNDALIFVDDDITIKSGFLNAYRTALLQHDNPAFLGGRIAANWRGRRPNWYRPQELPLLNGLVGDYDLGTVPLEYSKELLLPYGANFLLTRKGIESVGRFNEALGVNGRGIGRGEESDYFLRALKQSLTGFYVPGAQVEHRFQVERINPRYLFRYGLAKGQASQLNVEQSVFRAVVTIGKLLPRTVYQRLKGRLDNYYQCLINLGIQVAIIQKLRAVKN